MIKMGLVLSLDDISRIDQHLSQGYVLGDAVSVSVLFKTKAEVVQRLLPPPLEPSAIPIGYAYVAEFHRTNFGVTYNEAALFLFAQYNGIVGQYCLSMPVTDDMAMIGGREIYGFPKKIAETISVTRKGNEVTGMCIRKGITIIKINVNLTGPAKPEDNRPAMPNYLFKYFPHSDPRTGLFDYNPRLIKQNNNISVDTVEVGEGELTLKESQYDPIHEIPVDEVVSARYVEGLEVRMLPGEVIAEIDPVEFRPYSFSKMDWGQML
jgi:acetoacetate decarboxylase